MIWWFTKCQNTAPSWKRRIFVSPVNQVVLDCVLKLKTIYSMSRMKTGPWTFTARRASTCYHRYRGSLSAKHILVECPFRHWQMPYVLSLLYAARLPWIRSSHRVRFLNTPISYLIPIRYDVPCLYKSRTSQFDTIVICLLRSVPMWRYYTGRHFSMFIVYRSTYSDFTSFCCQTRFESVVLYILSLFFY